MGSTLNSYDALLAADSAKGAFRRALAGTFVNPTAATSTCGYVSIARCARSLSMPSSFGSGVTGCLFTTVQMVVGSTNNPLVAALEYTLGTLTVSGNSYADGVAMPSKLVLGNSVQTASLIPVLYVSSGLTATTPVVTINYTNQAGTTGRSCTLTLPSNPVANSCYLVTPHLQSGDTGIQDLSASSPNGLSISTGSAGTIKLLGLLPIGFGGGCASVCGSFDPLTIPWPMFPAEPNDVISFFSFGAASAIDLHAWLVGYADY